MKNLLKSLLLGTSFAMALSSCKKENALDNNNAIIKPYVLYVSDDKGSIMRTNDGKNFSTLLPTDGEATRAMITSGNNLIIVKKNRILVNRGGSSQFNAISSSLMNVSTKMPWKEFIIDVPSWGRVYSNNLFGDKGVTNYSPANGDYFGADTSFDKVDYPFLTESYAFVSGPNQLFCYSPSGTTTGKSNLFMKKHQDSFWTSVPTNLPTVTPFYLSSVGGNLVAIDYSGAKGVWLSSDNGSNFTKIGSLPVGVKIVSTYSFNNKLYIGLENLGLYVFNDGDFSPISIGVDANTTVYDMVQKENIFKNDAAVSIFFIATSTGLYKSQDNGITWFKTMPGKFTQVQ